MIGIKDEKFLLIASDVHNDDQSFETLAKMAESENCLALLYAGDLDVENCLINAALRCRNFVFIPVQGNCDNRWSWTDLGLDLPPYRTCSFNGLKIFLTHGHMYSSPSAVGLSDKDFDIVITGHSHVNSLEKQIIDGKEIVFLNPGSPSRPRGYSKASYAKAIFRENGLTSFEIRALNSDRLLSQVDVTFNKAPVGNN